jgi:hypothetical protein
MLLFTGRVLTVFFVLQLFLYCSVLTPYYKEDVLFSLHNLEEPNEDGVSILFYLQKIYPGYFLPCVTFYLGCMLIYIFLFCPLVSLEVDILLLTSLSDEWKNFLERVERKSEEH